jgi:hypothetical protein
MQFVVDKDETNPFEGLATNFVVDPTTQLARERSPPGSTIDRTRAHHNTVTWDNLPRQQRHITDRGGRTEVQGTYR